MMTSELVTYFSQSLLSITVAVEGADPIAFMKQYPPPEETLEGANVSSHLSSGLGTATGRPLI